MDAFGPGDGEESAHFGLDICHPPDLALALDLAVAVHRVDHPQHVAALAPHRADQRRQSLADRVRPETPDQRHLAGAVGWIEPVQQPQQFVGPSVGPAFTPTRFSIPDRKCTCAPSHLPGPVADPQHVPRRRPPPPIRIAPGQRLLIGQQQRLVAGEDRRFVGPGPAQHRRRFHRLRMGREHSRRVWRTRFGDEIAAVDAVPAIGRQTLSAACLGGIAARLGELARDPGDADHWPGQFRRQPVEQAGQCVHRRRGVEAQRLGAIAALEDEAVSARHLCGERS